VRVIGGAQEIRAPLPLGLGEAVVNVVGGHQAEGAVPVLDVVPREEALAERLGVLIGPNRAGKSGRYLRVLNCGQTRSSIANTRRSKRAELHTKVLEDGSPVHSFQTLLKELSTIVRNVCRHQGAGPDEPTFHVLTTPTPTQQRAYDLLNTITV
jgi:hypothetical protein